MDKNLLITIIIFAGLSFFMFMLFLYVMRRDKIIEEKFNGFELALEEIHKEIYKLKKESNIKKLDKIEKIIESIVDDVRMIESKNVEIIEELKEEIKEVKSRIKKNNLPDISMINKSDEEKIINLYKNGYSIEEISRELRIPAGEVELIVKFSSL